MGQPARKLSTPPPLPAKKKTADKPELVKPASRARPKIEKAANGPAPKTTAKKKATKKKVVKKVVKKKVVKKAAPKPVAKKAAPKPVAKKAAPKPVAKKAAPKPVAQKAAPKPVAKQAAPKPVAKQAAPVAAGVPEAIHRGATTPIDGASSAGVVSDSDTMSMAPVSLTDLEDLSDSAELSVVEDLGGGFAAAQSSADIEPAANAAPPPPPRRFHKAFAGAMLSAAALIGWGLLGGGDEAEPEVAAAVPTAFDLAEKKDEQSTPLEEAPEVETDADPPAAEPVVGEQAEEEAPAKPTKRRGKRKSSKAKAPKASSSPAASKKQPKTKTPKWRDPDAGKAVPPGTKMVNASEKKIQQTIRQGMYHVHRCYDSELRRDPSLRGRMEITVFIGVTGKVYRVAIHKNTVESTKVKECVRAKIKRWRFDFGGRLRSSQQVSFPISFKP